MEEVMNGILIREVETKNIMTKYSLPVGGYSVNHNVSLAIHNPQLIVQNYCSQSVIEIADAFKLCFVEQNAFAIE